MGSGCPIKTKRLKRSEKNLTPCKQRFLAAVKSKNAIGFDGFGGEVFYFYEVSAGKYGNTWIIALPDYYKPCKGLQRISDVAFEKIEARERFI